MSTLNVRNHLAVREVLRHRDDLRDEYAAVKIALAAAPDMDIGRYMPESPMSCNECSRSRRS